MRLEWGAGCEVTDRLTKAKDPKIDNASNFSKQPITNDYEQAGSSLGQLNATSNVLLGLHRTSRARELCAEHFSPGGLCYKLCELGREIVMVVEVAY